MPVKQRLIVSLELLSRDFNIEHLFASRPSPAAETDAHCRVVQQRQNRFCKLVGVSISDEEPGLAIYNGFLVATHVAGDYGNLRSHVLENGV